jgi:hypothetical protein
MTAMRAKMRVTQVERHSDTCETLHFSAVCRSEGYPEDGSDENNTFARFTPTASLSMSVTNPALIGEFAVDEEYYLDFSKAN